MASTLFSNQSQPVNQTTGIPTQVNNFINQILTAANPQAQFDNILSSNKDAQNAMNIVNQYGNGDPKTAFMNYMAQKGNQQLGQQIMSQLGLK